LAHFPFNFLGFRYLVTIYYLVNCCNASACWCCIGWSCRLCCINIM